jgi:ubiquitin-protein ligase
MGRTNSSKTSKKAVQVEKVSRQSSKHQLKKTSSSKENISDQEDEILLIDDEHPVSSNRSSSPTGLVGGGRLNKSIKTQEQLKKWLSEPVDELSIEQLISILYGYYSTEITYESALVDEIEAISHSFTANSPKSKTPTTKQYSGIGYSGDSSFYYSGKGKKGKGKKGKGIANNIGTKEEQHTNIEKIMMIIKQKFDYFLKLVDGLIGSRSSGDLLNDPATIEFSSKFTIEIMTRFAQWIYDSPLLHILHRNIQLMASGDFVRQVSSIIINFELVLQVELIYRKCLLLLPASTVIPGCHGPLEKNCQALDKQLEQYFEDLYRRLFHWSKLDLFCDQSELKWYKDLRELSDYWRILMEEDEEQQNYRLFHQSTCSSTCSSSDKAPHSVKKQEKRDQVIYVSSGIEEIHFHYQKNDCPAVHKCNKFFLKELKTLNDCLPEEITLFVAEEHPNYLIAVFSINNEDSPYFGGMWIFHIMIPQTYPAVSPKMHFMTTGYGTVRFNPNLYNCGKICLSLLGTWQGEPWDPKASNFNQALSSILFLIFTDEPYYNEPGYESQRTSGNRQSLAYNGAIVGNMICYGILDHLIKPHPIEEIYQHIHNYFEANWESMKAILEKKVEFHSKNKTLSREMTTTADINNITKTLAEKNKSQTSSSSTVKKNC